MDKHMDHFNSTVTYMLNECPPPELCSVWQVTDLELTPLGRQALTLVSEDPSLQVKAQKIAWGCQAVIEFQDLQAIALPQKGPFLNINYLFYQGMDTLRESVLAGINGLYHSSFATLRSSLEHFVFNQWWQSRLSAETDYSEFYDWLNGKKQSPPFAKVLQDVCSDDALEHSTIGLYDCKATYRRLCSYSHKPLIADCIPNLRGTNEPAVTATLIGYWLEMLELALIPIIEILVAYTPQCLFPVSPYRKFGFNPPVGAFFDQSNFIPLRNWLGSTMALRYAEHFKPQPSIVRLLKWYSELKELSDSDILATWNDKLNLKDDSDREIEERIIIRWCAMKAKLRALSLAFAYGMLNHSIHREDGTAAVTTWRLERA
jgi:hypothetical protein